VASDICTTDDGFEDRLRDNISFTFIDDTKSCLVKSCYLFPLQLDLMFRLQYDARNNSLDDNIPVRPAIIQLSDWFLFEPTWPHLAGVHLDEYIYDKVILEQLAQVSSFVHLHSRCAAICLGICTKIFAKL
jgi:hypothetical protein